MVFDLSTNLILTGFLLLFLWLSGATFFLYRYIEHYRKITHGIDKKTLQEILEKILTRQQETEAVVKKLLEQTDILKHNSSFYVQKIGLVRFNPFANTGGQQSFVLSLLDRNDNGILISSLFGRHGTRWYVKTIVEGKGDGRELSKEELEAIKEAKMLTKRTRKH